MKRLRYLLAGFLPLLLLLSLSLGAVAAPGNNNGVTTPTPWSDSIQADFYPVLSAATERSTGAPVTQSYTFTLKATLGRLTVANDGVRELDVTINGQRLNLNTFFDQGRGTQRFDISSLIHYGANTLEVESKGTPGTSASLTVEAPVLTARILHFNDIHGEIDPVAKAAAYVKAAKAPGGNVFFLDAGDNFSGGPVSDLNQGTPMIQVLNAAGVDLMTLGNHDMDHGPSNTQARRSESNFPWLSANTVVADPSATPIQPFDPYKIYTTAYGQKIAFVALTETPPSTGAKNKVGLTFNDPLATAQQYVAQLRDQVNLLVLVTHVGFDVDQRMAQQLTGVDLIVGAHSHTLLEEPVYQNGIPIVQAGADGKYLGDLIITQGQSVSVTGGATGGAYLNDLSAQTETDSTVQAIVDDWNARMAPTLDQKIGETAVNLDRGPRYDRDANIGNLITDAMRDYFGADMAFTNNGGIRDSIPKGDVTMRHVYSVLPFGNSFMLFHLTGAQIKQLIEFSWTRDNRFQLDLQTSGLRYAIYTKPGSGELDHVDLFLNGQPLDMNQTYTVSLADYIGTGGSGYPVPSMALPDDVSDQSDAIIVGEYIRKLGTLNYPDKEGRIQVRNSQLPTAVSKLNFYNSSTLLAADATGALVPLTDQATVLVTGESTAFQFERSAAPPKNFPKVNYPAGSPLPLAALEQVGQGQVVGLSAILVADGYRLGYQNPQWFTNLLDHLTGRTTGRVLFDEAHGQFFDHNKLGQIKDFLSVRGYETAFTGTGGPLTAASLQGADVFVITSPGSATFSADEQALLAAWVAGGGKLILASQTDFNNNSNPVEFNKLAAAIGTVIRFNSDEVRDNTSKDGTQNYSPLTNEFNQAFPDLLKVR